MLRDRFSGILGFLGVVTLRGFRQQLRSISIPELATWPVANTTRSALATASSFRIKSLNLTCNSEPGTTSPTLPLVKVTPFFWALR